MADCPEQYRAIGCYPPQICQNRFASYAIKTKPHTWYGWTRSNHQLPWAAGTKCATNATGGHMSRAEIDELALKYGWRLLTYQPNIEMVSYVKSDGRINIYLTKMTVATCIHHPVKGKTQLFRRRVPPKLLERIFANPRIHTGRGYYTRY